MLANVRSGRRGDKSVKEMLTERSNRQMRRTASSIIGA